MELIQNFLFKIAYAQTGVNNQTLDLSQYNPFVGGTLLSVIASIISLVRVIATPIAVLMILYGAFLILTAGAKPDNLKRGRQIIWYAILGYIVVLAAGSITLLLQNLLTSSTTP